MNLSLKVILLVGRMRIQFLASMVGLILSHQLNVWLCFGVILRISLLLLIMVESTHLTSFTDLLLVLEVLLNNDNESSCLHHMG